MLKTLKFVQGAVARKDHVPVLTHFRIQDGRITGYNGKMALSCPIDLDIDAKPNAQQLVKAISACSEEVTELHIAKSGRLCVRSGKFKTFVNCVEEDFPPIDTGGQVVKIEHPLLPSIKFLEPFVATDASRPWATGILLRGCSAFATNNICLVEYWVGDPFPVEVNLPHHAIKELLRLNEEPEKIRLTENRITFYYSGERWLSTNLLATEWPDLSSMLQRDPGNQREVPESFFDSLKTILPFTNELKAVYFKDGALATSKDAELEGTTIEHKWTPDTGCYNAEVLLNLQSIINTIDFDCYPKPGMFYGEKARGIIAGLRL